VEGRVTPEIRELGPDDYDIWADCSHALFPDEPRSALLADIRKYAGHGLGEVRGWLARRDGVVCGFAEVSLRPYANGCEDRPVVFLEAIWVAPEARRSGVGRALVDHLAGVARALGYGELGSDALIDNPISHAAHRAWGFVETQRVVHFRRAL
jgi:aminoglycoside 6'-N-acetyltransferase I